MFSIRTLAIDSFIAAFETIELQFFGFMCRFYSIN